MAVKLPDFTALGAENVYPGSIQPRYQESDPEAAANLQFGAGLEKAGTGGLAISSEAYQSANLANMALAQAKLHNDRARTLAQIEASNDPQEIDQLSNQLQGHLTSAGELIGDSRYRNLWTGHHSKEIADARLAAEKRQRTIYADRNVAGTLSQAEGLERIAAQTEDDAERNQAIEKIRTLFGTAARAGSITETQAQQLASKHGQGILLGRVQHLDSTNRPQAAEAYLDAHVGDLDADIYHREKTQLRARARRDLIRGLAAEALGDEPTTGGGAQPSQPTASKNLENFNFGNIKAVGGGWRTFGSEEEGAKAVGDWLVRAQDTHGRKTVRELIERYAPSSDPGNAGKNLPEVAAKAVGVDPDQPVAMSDPALRRKMVGAIVQQEFGNTQITRRALTAYDRAQTGTQLAAGPALTATDAGPAVAPPQTGPKPMESLERKLRRAAEIADREGLDDEQRDKLLRQTQSGYSLNRGKTEEQRKRLTDELQNGAALLKAGRPFAYGEARIRSLMEPVDADKYIAAMHDAEDEGAANIAIGRLSPAEQTQWREAISREVERSPAGAARRLNYLKHFDAATTKRYELLNGQHADPASYLITRDTQFPPPPGVTSIAALAEAAATGDPAAMQAYAAATMAEQARLGVLPENQHILTKNEASAEAQHVATTDPGTEDVGIRLAQLQKKYGGYWDKAFGDMNKLGGMPREAKVLGSMTLPEQDVGRQDMQRAIQIMAEKGGNARFRSNFNKPDVDNLTYKVQQAMLDFQHSTPATVEGSDLTHDVRESVETLALYYLHRGDSVNSAVEKAMKGVINVKYDFESTPGGTLRVPKEQAGLMETAGDAVQHHIRPEDLEENLRGMQGQTPERKREILLDAIRRGYWQTNDSDDGAVLYLRAKDGAPILARLKSDTPGQPGPRIEFKWSDARRLSAFAPAVPFAESTGGEAAMLPTAEFIPMGYRALMLGR